MELETSSVWSPRLEHKHRMTATSAPTSSVSIACSTPLSKHHRRAKTKAFSNFNTIPRRHGIPEPDVAKYPKARAATAAEKTSRRGHFNSRIRCLNCKRRRVKCNEFRPSCTPCTRLGLSCSYPTPGDSPLSKSAAIHPNPSDLAMGDLRFYHHFLTKVFPTMPFGGKDTWMECAAMSHQYELLAHSILALGASHLTSHGRIDYSEQALTHRVEAIRMINKDFAKCIETPQHMAALLGALLCLLSQTAFLPDGMMDHFILMRGTGLLIHTNTQLFQRSLFREFSTEEHLKSIDAVVDPAMARDFTHLDGLAASLQQLRPLIAAKTEIDYFHCMLKCVESGHKCPKAAWGTYVDLYRIHSSVWTSEEFVKFANPENHVGQMLISHNHLLNYILGQLCIPETYPKKNPARRDIIITWARTVLRQLPDDMKMYGHWMSSYCIDLENGDCRYLLTP